MKSKYTFNEIEEFLDKTSKLKISNVYIQDLLASGKAIGSIKVDDTTYNLLAPSTYAWGEITSKPTNAAGYGITNVVLKQDYINLNDLATQHAQVMGYGNPDGGWRSYSSGILSKVHDSGFALQGLTNTLFFRGISGSVWEDNWHEVLHTGNYATILGTVYAPYNAAGYLPLGGGTITGLLTLKPQGYHAIDIVSPDNNLAQITMSTNDTLRGIFQYNANFGFGFHHLGCGGLYVASDGVPKYVDSSSAKYPIIHEGNYNLYALPLSGGTLTDSVMVNHSSGSKGYLLLTNGASIGGLVTNGTAVELFNVNGYGIGVEGTSDVYVLTNWAKKTLLHAGNVGDYKAGGLVAIDSRNKNYAPYSNEFTKKALTSHFERALSIGYGANDYYVSMLHISPWSEESGGPEHQLAFRADGAIGYRHGSTVWSNWKTIAFTDSTVAGAYTLKNTAGVSVAYVDTNGFFYIGDGIYADTSLKLIGKNIYLASGASATTGLILNPSGNVTIGDAEYAGETYKLFVHDKKAFIHTHCGETPALGSLPERGLILGHHSNGTPSFGMMMWTEGNGRAGIQVGRYNGTAEAFNLCLNPLGGNVGIGTTSPKAKLHVNGTILAKENVMTLGTYGGYSLYGGIRDGEAFSLETTNSEAAWQACAMRVTLSGAVSFNHNVSVRTRLLVGAPTDDGTSALQVNGDIVIPNYTAYKAYDTNGGKMNLMYLDTSNRLRVYNDTMSFTPQAKVGIGTPTPQEKLHVVGNLYVTGNIIADGQVSSGQSITFVDANGNNHILSGDDTAGGLKIDDKIITVN